MILCFNDLNIAENIKYSTYYLCAICMHRKKAYKLLNQAKRYHLSLNQKLLWMN